MKIKYLLLLIVFFISCQEEFKLESGLNNNSLVVNGIIDNSSPPYIITLSRTSDAGDPLFIPVTGGILTITDINGNSEQLNELEPGIYKSSETGMKGETGNSYKLNIKLPGGDEYESEYQRIKNTIEIDSVYYEEESEISSKYPLGLPGYRFYVNTKEAENTENYFLWKMTETFQYNTDYNLSYFIDSWGRKIYDTSRYDTLETCWKTSQIKDFTTETTINLANPIIKRKPLQFVGTDTKKLTILYSILLKQYVINKSAYDFWNSIEKLESDDNFLTSYQPYNVQGNVKNIKNEDEPVFGYFTVAAVSEKRIFVNTIHAPFFYQKSFVITDKKQISDYMSTHNPPYFFVTFTGVDGQTTDGLLYFPSCLDCRNEGGSIYKPDFWTFF